MAGTIASVENNLTASTSAAVENPPPTGEPILQPQQPGRLKRWARQAGVLACGPLAAMGTYAEANLLVNYEYLPMIPGLVVDGDMELPENVLGGCTIDLEDLPEPLPSLDFLKGQDSIRGGNSDNEPQDPETPPTTDPEQERANEAKSAAHKNNVFDVLRAATSGKITDQYDHMFDNPVGEHTSSITGIQYKIYAFDIDPATTEPTPEFNFDSLEILEIAPFVDLRMYRDPDTQRRVACMGQALIGRRELAGTVRPIVVPTTPACYSNGYLVDLTATESGECKQDGFTMPEIDLHAVALRSKFGLLMPWITDITPVHDNFHVITTGSQYDQKNPWISPTSTAHELLHETMPQLDKADRAANFNLSGEEATMHYFINDRIKENLALGCVLPFVTYNADPKTVRATVSETCKETIEGLLERGRTPADMQTRVLSQNSDIRIVRLEDLKG